MQLESKKARKTKRKAITHYEKKNSLDRIMLNIPLFSVSFEGFNLRDGMELKSL